MSHPRIRFIRSVSWQICYHQILAYSADPFPSFPHILTQRHIKFATIQNECTIWMSMDATKSNWNNCATIWGLCLSIVSSLDILSNELLEENDPISESD